MSDKLAMEKFRPRAGGGNSLLLGSMPAVDPTIYQKITGHPCSHDFKRTGFCRFGRGVIGCGHFGAGTAFRPRLEVLEVIFRTYGRIPDQELAKASLATLDRIFPPTVATQEAHKIAYDFEGAVKNLNTVSLLLSVVETPEEWRATTSHFENGFQGDPPFIFDPEFIRKRMESKDPLVRQGCVAAASVLKIPPDDAMLSMMLDDSDQNVSREAGDKIFYSSRLELFGKLFKRHKPDSYRIEQMASYSGTDLTKLLALDVPELDDVCFEALVKGQRLEFLDQVVARLNHRNSASARNTALRLIEGPRLGSGTDTPADPWEWMKSLDGSLEEAVARVRNGDSGDFWLLLKSMKTLAATRDRLHWSIAKRAYEQAISDGTSEFHMAIMAKALMEIDPDQTRAYLLNEIKGEKSHRLLSALAGMGLIASPDFKDAVIQFIANPYPPKYYFEKGEPKRIAGYALHRCSGIQDWKLIRDKDGIYSIQRP